MNNFKIGDVATKEELQKSKFDGYVRGEYFESTWHAAPMEDDDMKGYCIYRVGYGEIQRYGDFSPSGELQDIEDCGDLCEAINEKFFTIMEVNKNEN